MSDCRALCDEQWYERQRDLAARLGRRRGAGRPPRLTTEQIAARERQHHADLLTLDADEAAALAELEANLSNPILT